MITLIVRTIMNINCDKAKQSQNVRKEHKMNATRPQTPPKQSQHHEKAHKMNATRLPETPKTITKL